MYRNRSYKKSVRKYYTYGRHTEKGTKNYRYMKAALLLKRAMRRRYNRNRSVGRIMGRQVYGRR